MSSISKDLLRTIFIKYGGVPPKEAILALDEMDEIRRFDTEVALLAALATVGVGNLAYAIDTGAIFLRGASAFTLMASPQADASAFLQKVTTIEAADIKLMASAPPIIVPAVAGKMNVLHGLSLELVAGSEVLSVNTGDDLIANYVAAGGLAATAAMETTGFLDQATNTFLVAKGIAVLAGTVAEVVNTPIVLDNNGVEFAGNATDDAQLIVWARYSLLTVTP